MSTFQSFTSAGKKILINEIKYKCNQQFQTPSNPIPCDGPRRYYICIFSTEIFFLFRAFDEVAMPRALYGRLQGVKFPAGISVKTPEIHRLTWKPSRMADKTTIYSFAWCEGCHLDVIRADVGQLRHQFLLDV